MLSDEFYREITGHPIPTDLEATKALSSCPAARDLYMWLSYCCFTAKGRERALVIRRLWSGEPIGQYQLCTTEKIPREVGGLVTSGASHVARLSGCHRSEWHRVVCGPSRRGLVFTVRHDTEIGGLHISRGLLRRLHLYCVLSGSLRPVQTSPEISGVG